MKTLRTSKGFTLIELLVVMAVIGVLSAIAVQQFTAYQQRSFDAQAQADLRNAVTAEEAYYATYQIYKTGSDTGPGQSSFLQGLVLSPSVSLSMVAAGGSAFSGTAESSHGSRVFMYDSDAGFVP